jgi:O-acetylhomoserine/O-acetylserine sulfhydrylase-like pyridoxal-dependent enzyme
MSLKNPDKLELEYAKAMMSWLLFHDVGNDDILLMGLGGGSLAKYMLNHFPACRVEAVEYRAAVAEVAHAHGLPLIIDNTVPSPFLCNPIALGADIVVHSATKYLAGHGTTLGGVIVESGKFPWDNGKFPGMTEPSKGYHGVKFYETFGDFGFTMRCRMESLRVYGAELSPMSAWQILQGVETLPELLIAELFSS